MTKTCKVACFAIATLLLLWTFTYGMFCILMVVLATLIKLLADWAVDFFMWSSNWAVSFLNRKGKK